MWWSFQLIKADLNSSSKLYSQWPRICALSGLSFHHPWVNFGVENKTSLTKQDIGDATTAFSERWRLRNERRNFTLMTRQYPGMGSISDWLKQISRAARPIRNTTHTWVVTRHQYGISALVSQTSFRGKTSGGVAKCLLFSQARLLLEIHVPLVSCNKFYIFLWLSDHCIFPLLIF